MTWEIIRNTLGIFFLLSIFILVPILLLLANKKKRFFMYINQIKKHKEIQKNISFTNTQFDILIATYIFMKLPSLEKNPEIYKISEIITEKDSIEKLTKIAKSLCSFFIILVITLIITLNIFEK